MPYVQLRTTIQEDLDLAGALASWFPHTQVRFAQQWYIEMVLMDCGLGNYHEMKLTKGLTN